MRRTIIGAGLVAVLAVAFAFVPGLAQDPAVVASKNYKVVMENDRVRVLEMRLQPGEMDNQHSHPSEVVYFVNAAKAQITLPDGKTVDAELPKGHVMWHDAWTHRVKNTGTEELVAIVVELKDEAAEDAAEDMEDEK